MFFLLDPSPNQATVAFVLIDRASPNDDIIIATG